MDDKIITIILIFVSLFGVYYGLSLVSSKGAVSFSGGLDGFVSEPSKLFASAFAAVETDFSSSNGQFLISFDNFKNVHKAIVDKKEAVKVFDVDNDVKNNAIYLSTDSGIFISKDGGLTWNNFNSSNNEINPSSLVFRIIPLSSGGEDYLVSVYSNGYGVVYRTYDYFFNLENLIYFKNEAVYDMHVLGNDIYLALSNGQMVLFNLNKKTSRVVNVFDSPVVKIEKSPSGIFFLTLKSGSLMKGSSLQSSFERVKTPNGDFMLGSSKVRSLDFDQRGNIYLLNDKGAYIGNDGGDTFNLLKTIPLQEEKINIFEYNNGNIYVISGRRMYVSANNGKDWKITDLQNEFSIKSVYFIGSKVILSM